MRAAPTVDRVGEPDRRRTRAGRARLRRNDEPASRGTTVHLAAHGRLAPAAHLPEARHQFASRAGSTRRSAHIRKRDNCLGGIMLVTNPFSPGTWTRDQIDNV